ncbi:MAG TPA: hypothetical protein ENK55_02915 [Actinobacteria bacterium]|nr:hypothetical protein [Actinomycetota bacterium]
MPRPVVTPVLLPDPRPGYRLDDPYVRRFWVAALGPGAVADLLRLAAAARRGRSLLRPVHLPLLLEHDLARRIGGRIGVRPTVPPLAEHHLRRLHPALRREHALAAGEPATPGTLPAWPTSSPAPSRS